MTGTTEEREAWLYAGYGNGINDAKAAQVRRRMLLKLRCR
jgi:hypothetical protein